MTDRLGQQLGSYRLIRLLGQGGFADVYLGEHVHLNTLAAIKLLRTELAGDDLSNFRTEARTIAHLIHPNIVQVLDFGVEGTTPFLVMAYAPNGTLRQRHPRGVPLPWESVIAYVKQVASALQYAHDKKLIHRDIKPENMLLGRNNEVLLSDFGIALVTPSARAESMFGRSIPSQTTWDPAGTVTYMAPEQIQGKPTVASDQYALGIVVYEWLSGVPPFGGGYMEIAMQHMSVLPTPLSTKVPTLSPDVEKVVMTALAKEPQRRFGSIEAFATALEQAHQAQLPTYMMSSSSSSPVPTVSPGEHTMEAVLYGPSGRIILGSTVVTIGRNARNQLVVNDLKVSSFHAEIRPLGQGYSINDLNSTNGTFVNEQQLPVGGSRLLSWGDTIRVGDTKLSYSGGSATQDMAPRSEPSTLRAEPGYSGYIPAAPTPPPPISITGYGGDAQQAYPQSPPLPSYYPSAPQPQQPLNTPPGVSAGFPGNMAPAQFNMSGNLSGNAPPVQSSYSQPVILPAPSPSFPGITGTAPISAGVPVRPTRRGLWILLSAVLVVLLVGGGVFAFVLYQNSQPTPTKSLDAFCTALQAGDYSTAYSQLSTNFQAKIPMSEFDGFYAKISSCAHGTPNQSGSNASASLTTVSAGQTNNDSVTLAQDSNHAWKIDMDQNLFALTSLLDGFCSSLKSGDYQTAYGQLSSNFQNRISSLTLFTSFYPNVASCMSTALTMMGVNATASVTIATPNATENDQATLIQDSNSNNAWKIDQLTNLSTPGKTLQAYCDEIRNQKFSDAHEQLSQAERSNLSPTDLATHYSGVNTCSVSNVDNSAGHGSITYIFQDGSSATADYDLLLENGIWKIDQEHVRTS